MRMNDIPTGTPRYPYSVRFAHAGLGCGKRGGTVYSDGVGSYRESQERHFVRSYPNFYAVVGKEITGAVSARSLDHGANVG